MSASSSVLEGKSALVIGATEFAVAVAERLRQNGCRTSIVRYGTGTERGGQRAAGDPEVSWNVLDPREVIASEVERAAAEMQGVDVVVYIHYADSWVETEAVAEMGEDAWVRRCEDPIQAALFTSQAALTQLVRSGGRLIYVLPTVALTGARLLVPYAASAEGIRGLAKSIARKYGPSGVTVAQVVVPVEVMARGTVGASADFAGLNRSPARPALPQERDDIEDVGSVVTLLASDLAAAVTGATIVVDKGVLMP
jgi:NAD(P)-dependent dehydrogenase (short-subunit alcohol dehydrogenase family)